MIRHQNPREHRSRQGWALALCGALTLIIAGCGSKPVEPPPDANPLVFEVIGPDGAIEGWLLGTIHALPDGVSWRTPAIEQAISDADYLVVEIAQLDDSERTAATFANLATSARVLQPLAERVEPAQRAALDRLVARSDLAPRDFVHTETWAAALMLAQLDSNGKASNGVDLAVIREFSGREVREFEGVLGQLRIFDRLAERDQRDLLQAVVESSDEGTDSAAELRDAWLTGDLQALEDATTTGMMADVELRDALLVDRNQAWLESLLVDLEKAPKPLVAVGAAHLVGPDGLPALLEDQGYTVRRLE